MANQAGQFQQVQITKENLTQPTRARNRTMAVVEAVIDDYFAQHDLRKLVHELLTDIVRNRPEDPTSYCATYFQKGELFIVKNELAAVEEKLATERNVVQNLKTSLISNDPVMKMFEAHVHDSLSELLKRRWNTDEDARRDFVDSLILESFKVTDKYIVCVQIQHLDDWFQRAKTAGTIAIILEIRKAIQEVFVLSKGRLIKILQHQMLFEYDVGQDAYEFAACLQDLFLRHNAAKPDEKIELACTIVKGTMFQDSMLNVGIPLLVSEYIAGKGGLNSKIVIAENAFKYIELSETGASFIHQEIIQGPLTIPCVCVTRDEAFAKANDYRRRQTLGIKSTGRFNEMYDTYNMGRDVANMEYDLFIVVIYFMTFSVEFTDKMTLYATSMIESFRKTCVDISARKEGVCIANGPNHVAFHIANGEVAYQLASACVRSAKRMNENILDKLDALHCSAAVNHGPTFLYESSVYGDTYHFAYTLAKDHGKPGQLHMTRSARENSPSSQLVKFSSSKVDYGGKMKTVFGHIVQSMSKDSDSD